MTSSRLFVDDLEHVLTHGGEAFESLRNARLFLTGGTGFVGKWLLESLLFANERLGLGVRVVVLTRRPAAFEEAFPHLLPRDVVTLHGGDIRSFDYPEGAFTHVIHAAADVVEGVSPLDAFDTTVEGTRRVLNMARDRGAKRFLFVSSGAVYGRQPPELTLVPESYNGAPCCTEPGSAYGSAKRAAEWLTTAYSESDGMVCAIARCFAFVGPYLPLDKQFAIGNFLSDILAGRQIEVKNGAPVRSYLYAADLAAWLWGILAKGAGGVAYNVGSSEAISIAELAERVSALRYPAPQSSAVEMQGNDTLPERYVPCIEKAKSLGLRPVFDLNESLRRTYAWLERGGGERGQ